MFSQIFFRNLIISTFKTSNIVMKHSEVVVLCFSYIACFRVFCSVVSGLYCRHIILTCYWLFSWWNLSIWVWKCCNSDIWPCICWIFVPFFVCLFVFVSVAVSCHEENGEAGDCIVRNTSEILPGVTI